MEFQKVIEPAKELIQSIGEWALNKIVPPESVEIIRQESSQRTSQLFAHKESQEE